MASPCTRLHSRAPQPACTRCEEGQGPALRRPNLLAASAVRQQGPSAPQAPFFNAANLLERKSLGDFLKELDALSGWAGGLGAGATGGREGGRAAEAGRAGRRAVYKSGKSYQQGACLPPGSRTQDFSEAKRLPPPPGGCRPLAGPAKPPELVKFSTTDSVGHAMRVGDG